MRVCNGLHQMLLKLPTKRKLSFYIFVVKKYEEYWCKNMRNTGAKIVHLCTIATIIMHIYTVTIACAFNILLVFSLSCLYSHSHSHLTLSLFLLSPHLTPPSSLPSSLVGTEPNSSLLVVKVVVLVLEFL